MSEARKSLHWGAPPWKIEFGQKAQRPPAEADIAIVGGGFTGLAAAAWLRRLSAGKSVVLLEAECLGAGASGRTGGLVLGGTAAGDLPGLGDVLEGFERVLDELEVDCELELGGAWEIARRGARKLSPIAWQDSGTLRIAREIPGGTADPGKLVSGLARAARRRGAILCEQAPVRGVASRSCLELRLSTGRLRAGKALFATNAQALELSGLVSDAQPKFTLAVATEPMSEMQLKALGLSERKPFYTVDLPYLWGRVLASNEIAFGSGVVHLKDWREFRGVDIGAGEAAELIRWLEQRVRGLHPTLHSVKITHRWGGPILFANSWRPVFSRHPRVPNAWVLGAYSGHGVALSVYLGCWAAEAMLGWDKGNCRPGARFENSPACRAKRAV